MQQGRLNTWLSFRSAQPSKVAQFSVGANTKLNAPVTPPGCSRRGNWRGVMAWRVATLKDVVLNGGDLPPCKIH
jgi:hypothetical protein